MLKMPAGETFTLTANGTQYAYPLTSVPLPALAAGEVRRINIQLGVTAVEDWQLY